MAVPEMKRSKWILAEKIYNSKKRNIIDCTNTCVWLIEPFYSLLWFFSFYMFKTLILIITCKNIAHFRVFCVWNGQFVGILVLEYSLTKCLSLIENSRQNCISTSKRNQMSFVILMAVFALSVTICHIHMFLSQIHSFHLPMTYTILMCFCHIDFG